MNQPIRKQLLLLSLFFASNLLWAQEKVPYSFVDARNLTVLGQAATAQGQAFHRVNTAGQQLLPKRVAELARNSAGISVMFQTNAKNISVKWVLGKFNTLWNMTPLAVNGMDLYGFKGTGWQYVASARPTTDSNNVVLITGLDGQMRHYCLYLPLYSEAVEVQVGVDSGAVIRKANPERTPVSKVVIYGSSITQGASASRPGMAYPSILARSLNIETFNMGFSGAGKMELPVADVLAGMEADLYVLDCVPNPSAEEIRERAVPFIKRLRALKPGKPIVLVESIIREAAWWSQAKHTEVMEQNKAFREAYEQLLKMGYTQLYYVRADKLIGNDHEATIDGTHLTDLGFTRIAKQLEAIIVKALQKKPAL